MPDESAELAPGQRVRFLPARLGIIDPSVSTAQFVPEVVLAGELGTVMTEAGGLPLGWYAVKPDSYPEGIVPVDPDMVEPITPEEEAT